MGASGSPTARSGVSLAPMRPELSIVIVNRNTCGLLRSCLESIRALPDLVTREVVVVDNGSTDGSQALVRTEHPTVRLLANEENAGYAAANNQGLRVASGRYLLLLNSDTIVLPGATDRMVHFMEEHPRVGACGPRLLYPDGRLQPSCFSFPSPRTYWSRMLSLDVLFPRSSLVGNLHCGYDYCTTGPTEALLGAALLIRRTALEQVGMLDEGLALHYNDFDWCLRCWHQGWQVFYLHDATIVHHLAATTTTENRDLRIQGRLVADLFAFFSKHHGRRGLALLRMGMVVGFGARLVALQSVAVLRGRPQHPDARRFRWGMTKAGLLGDPDQFQR